MKRKLLLTTILCALLPIGLLAQVAHFPFDDDEIDILENINASATPTGVSYVEDNQREMVMELDGANGFITFPGNDVYDFDALTYNLWFKWNHAVADQWWVRIFDFGIPSDLDPHPGNHDVVFLTTYQDGRLRWHIHSVDWTDGQDTILSSLEQIALNTWYMLTCTHDADSAKLYLNGVLQDARGVSGVKPSDLEFTNMYLGKSNWPDLLFLGRMDDFRIYNSILTQEEIEALYVINPIAIPDPEINDGISIYSAGNELIIRLLNPTTDATLSVYNLQGMEVLISSELGSYTNINSLNPGIYIVQVTENGAKLTKKVLIH
jgi:hypothetical protein